MLDQILQNSTDTIDIEIYKDGVLTDADDGVTVTITNPNDVVIYSSQSATKTATGKYSFSVASTYTDILGTFTATWSFELSSSAMQHTSEFEVVSAISTGYLLTSEYRANTTLDVSEKTDAQLAQYIKRATYLIESYIGGSVRLTTYQEKLRAVIDYPNYGLHIQLDHAPVDSLTSAVVQFNPSYEVTLTTTNFRINEDSGYLEYFGLNLTNAMVASIQDLSVSTIEPYATIVYTAGYSEIPEKVELATSRLVDQLINQETGQFKQLKSVTINRYTETYETGKNATLPNEIGSDEVVELLKDYRHPVIRNRFIV